MAGNAASEAARILASVRRRVTGICAFCGKPFSGTVRRTYCSPRCCWRAYYYRNRASILAGRRR